MNGYRLENATKYLIYLLQGYGHRLITVKIKEDGETVDVMAISFIKRQLTKLGIYFPYSEANKPYTYRLNTSLDKNKLTVIFHEAIMEFEEAYVEEKCADYPQAENFINKIYEWIDRKWAWIQDTFPEYTEEELNPFLDRIEVKIKVVRPEAMQKAKELLAEVGITKIESIDDLNMLFWQMAIERKPINLTMSNAIRTIIENENLLKKYERYRFLYDKLLSTKKAKVDDLIENQKQTISKLKHEINNLKQAIQSLEKQNNILKSEDRQKNNLGGKFSRKVINQIKTQNGRFFKTYDLTLEKDVNEYLSWYKLAKRPVSQKTINSVLSYLKKEGKSPDLFVERVEALNSQLTEKGYVALEEEDDDE